MAVGGARDWRRSISSATRALDEVNFSFQPTGARRLFGAVPGFSPWSCDRMNPAG